MWIVPPSDKAVIYREDTADNSVFKGTLVKNGEFTEVSLEDYKGKWVVLASYPMDFTCECRVSVSRYEEWKDGR